MSKGPPAHRRAERVLVVGGLAAAAALVTVGALLHPVVEGSASGVARHVAESRMWVPAHILLTLGQLLAAPTAAVALARITGARDRADTLIGLTLVVVGLVLGAFGTLTAATGLATAARAHDPATPGLFAVVNAWALGIGWLSLVAGSLGGVVVGARLAREDASLARVVGFTGVAGGGAFLVAAAAFAFGLLQDVFHGYVLRGGALFLGVVLALIAVATAKG